MKGRGPATSVWLSWRMRFWGPTSTEDTLVFYRLGGRGKGEGSWHPLRRWASPTLQQFHYNVLNSLPHMSFLTVQIYTVRKELNLLACTFTNRYMYFRGHVTSSTRPFRCDKLDQ